MSKSVQTIDGVQVGVESNEGTFETLKHRHGSRNALVTILVPKLNEPVTCSIDTDDLSVWTPAQQMWSTGGRFAFRIEIHRDASVDPTIPFDDVPKTKAARHRRLVWMEPVSPATGFTPPEPPAAPSTPPVAAADTRPSGLPADPRWTPQDPAAPLVCPLCPNLLGRDRVLKHEPSGRFAHVSCLQAEQPGPGPLEAPTAAAADHRGLADTVLANLAAYCIPAGALSPGQADLLAAVLSGPHGQEVLDRMSELTKDRPAAPPTTDQARPGPRMEEGKPFQRTNSDGGVNLGSYAIQAALGMVELAHELLVEHRQHEHFAGPPPPNHIHALAARLLDAADKTQQMVRADGHFDRMDNSHTRARGAIRVALKSHPVPWDVDPAVREGTRAKWVDDMAAYAAELIRIAVRLDR